MTILFYFFVQQNLKFKFLGLEIFDKKCRGKCIFSRFLNRISIRLKRFQAKIIYFFIEYFFLLESSENHFDIVASKIRAKKYSPKNVDQKYCEGGLSPPKPPALRRVWLPTSSPGALTLTTTLGAPPPGLGRFWIECPQPTDYWVSLVKVFESGS